MYGMRDADEVLTKVRVAQWSMDKVPLRSLPILSYHMIGL